jgi:hypothetical protein
VALVPAEAVPAENSEGADDAHRASGMALHDRGVEDGGEHHEVTL